MVSNKFTFDEHAQEIEDIVKDKHTWRSGGPICWQEPTGICAHADLEANGAVNDAEVDGFVVVVTFD